MLLNEDIGQAINAIAWKKNVLLLGDHGSGRSALVCAMAEWMPPLPGGKQRPFMALDDANVYRIRTAIDDTSNGMLCLAGWPYADQAIRDRAAAAKGPLMVITMSQCLCGNTAECICSPQWIADVRAHAPAFCEIWIRVQPDLRKRLQKVSAERVRTYISAMEKTQEAAMRGFFDSDVTALSVHRFWR